MEDGAEIWYSPFESANKAGQYSPSPPRRWERGQGEGNGDARQNHRKKTQVLNRSRAKEMRSKPVTTENLFWAAVRNRKLGNYKFRRQVLIGPYIADFVCLEKKLIVELDGPLHDAAYDAKRDAYLKAQGYQVLRFTNGSVGDDFTMVLLTVREALTAPSPNPLPRLRGGEG